jgi:hypothetical protein
MQKTRKAYNIVVGEPEEITWIIMCSWKDNIKMDPTETGCEEIQLHSNISGYVSIAVSCEQDIELSVSIKAVSFLTIFSRNIPHHKVRRFEDVQILLRFLGAGRLGF